MGLKLRWFRARVSFVGSSSKDSEAVTGIGFKQVNSAEFPTYTQISEFAPLNNQSYERHKSQARKEQNLEVTLKVRSMLNRSLSNVQASRELSTSKSCENISTINHEDQPQIISNTLPNRKAQAPKPILKRNDSPVRRESEEEVILRNGNSRSVENLQERPKAVILPDNVPIESNSDEKQVNIANLIDLDDIPPPVNYSTLPVHEPKSILKQWDEMINSTDDESNENNYSEIQDEPYVIELQEGNQFPEYAEVNKERKQKKSISFDDQVETINDDDSDIYANIMDTVDQGERARSSNSSTMSSSSNNPTSEDENETDREKDLYGNDYTNTKRTSYFQAGSSTYSTQAASIFFGNKKPVAERRPTKRYINHTPDGDTDSQTSA